MYMYLRPNKNFGTDSIKCTNHRKSLGAFTRHIGVGSCKEYRSLAVFFMVSTCTLLGSDVSSI